MCQSIYFAGPERLCLELSYSSEPADFADQGGAALQPGVDARGPHMTSYPPRLATSSTSDDVSSAATQPLAPCPAGE